MKTKKKKKTKKNLFFKFICILSFLLILRLNFLCILEIDKNLYPKFLCILSLYLIYVLTFFILGT